MANLLFICSRNQWRNPTAEELFKNHAFHRARSAGTSPQARIRVNQKLLDWADEIWVMERRHKQLLQQRLVVDKPVIVLNITDDYQLNDPKLILLLKELLRDYM